MPDFRVFFQKFLPVAVGAFLSCGGLKAQQGIQLSYHFQAGDHFQMTQDDKVDNYQTIQGVTARVTQETTSTMDFKVISVTGSDALMTVKFVKLLLAASSMDQKMVINTSASGENDKVNALFKSIIGQPFTLTLQSSGQIDSIGGVDQMVHTVLGGVGDTSDTEQAALSAILKSQISPEALRTSLQQLLPYYPASMVSPGEQWKNSVVLPGPPAGTMASTWTLTYGDKLAIQLGYSANFSTTDPDAIIPLGEGFNGKIELSGTVEGNYSIDPATGWPKLCVQHTEYKGTYHYLANKKLKLKSNLDVPVRIISDNEVRFLHL
jgi:hypothetical protein